MAMFIESNRELYGVEPICRILPIAPSTYCAWRERHFDPEKRSARSKRDKILKTRIEEIWDENFGVYGVLKIWHQLLREDETVARCTVARLMRELGLQGIQRGSRFKVTTRSNEAKHIPQDLVERNFNASRPDELWVADMTYVQIGSRFYYVAFEIDVYSRKIVGWSLANSLATDLLLRALEQAMLERQPAGPLVHHSDRGIQYLSIRYTKRLEEAGIENSVGSVGDSYDNALAETIIGLFKTEIVRPLGPWRSSAHVEKATFEWVDWYNKRRLFSSLDYKISMEFEQMYYLNQATPATLEGFR